MKDTPFHDPDQLMLAQADAGLVLVDPASGRIEGLNPAWPQWLGRSKASLQGAVFWEEGGWQQPDVVRTLVSLTSLPLAMPPMAVTGMTQDQQSLSLVMSARSVNLADRRLVLCTLVRSSLAQAMSISSSVVDADPILTTCAD